MSSGNFTRACIALSLVFAGDLAADWNPKLAADYLDRRQQEWSSWPTAAGQDGPCFSCHTGMTYLLARPALRRLLGESQSTKWEESVLQKMAASAGKEPPGQLRMVETIYEALFLGNGDARDRALGQMWSLQYGDGNLKGGWAWYNANLEPWEGPSSFYFGSTMAALAVGRTPADYRARPEINGRIEAMKTYLLKNIAERPLHNRLELLWAATALPDLLTASQRKAIVEEIEAKQQDDGSWTLAAIGPWPQHPDGADVIRPSAYATAFTSYVLLQAGRNPAGASLKKALDWLVTHQDPKTGAWKAVSMNKQYPAGSMQELFLQDGATGFAVAALSESRFK